MQNSNYLSNEKGSGAVCSSKEMLHSAELAPGERIDDLQLNGLSLIQSRTRFDSARILFCLRISRMLMRRNTVLTLARAQVRCVFCFTAEQAAEFLELKLTHGKRIVFCVPFV